MWISVRRTIDRCRHNSLCSIKILSCLHESSSKGRSRDRVVTFPAPRIAVALSSCFYQDLHRVLAVSLISHISDGQLQAPSTTSINPKQSYSVDRIFSILILTSPDSNGGLITQTSTVSSFAMETQSEGVVTTTLSRTIRKVRGSNYFLHCDGTADTAKLSKSAKISNIHRYYSSTRLFLGYWNWHNH